MIVIKTKHLRAVRWFHWINFPLLALMIWSGILIYWANDVYRVGWRRVTIFHFFTNGFYSTFHLDHQLANGMAYHFFLMWLFTLNGIAYTLYTAISGEWRMLLPSRDSFSNAWQTVLFDLHICKISPIQGKYNGAQQITYTLIVVMGALSVMTGFAIYKPSQLSWLTAALGGYDWARWEHFWLMMGYCGFFAIHIAQVLRAGWNNARAMITGEELVDV